MLRCQIKKKRVYGVWDFENMCKVIIEVKFGYFFFCKVVEKYFVFFFILSDRVSGKVKEDGVWGLKFKLFIKDE